MFPGDTLTTFQLSDSRTHNTLKVAGAGGNRRSVSCSTLTTSIAALRELLREAVVSLREVRLHVLQH